MHVMLTGSTGLVGAALTPFLTGQGHQVRRLRREPSGEAETTHWNPADGTFARGAFDGIDAVVHGDRYRPPAAPNRCRKQSRTYDTIHAMSRAVSVNSIWLNTRCRDPVAVPERW